MAKNQQAFFATRGDLESLLRAVESERQLQFVETGLFDSPNVRLIDSLVCVPGLGHLGAGDHNQGPCYLVCRRGTSIVTRPVPQRRGGTKYAIDQEENPRTLVFRPSGIYRDCFLIDGQVGTISDDPDSLDLFRLFRHELRRQFEKVQEFYVGREAGVLLDQGWRLTANAKSPPSYDLKRV